MFVQEQGHDGRPNLSHAWCRTIDGVQGGTWAQVHLLGTPALDNHRGYVGQSRSIHPTHTWNTVPVAGADHGGRVVGEEATASEQVAAALRRARPKTFAAVDDPYRIDRRLREEIATQLSALNRRPPDASVQIANTKAALHQREAELAEARFRAAHWEAVADSRGGLRVLTVAGRARRANARTLEEVSERAIGVCEHQVAECTAQLDKMEVTQAERAQFDRSNGWRAGRISELERRLEAHWASAVVAAARAGDPYAYGPDRLRQARRHLLFEASSVVTTDPAPAVARASEVASRLQETAPGAGPGGTDLNDVEAAIIRARKVHAANAAQRARLRANPRHDSAPTGGHEHAVSQRGIQRDL